ncbi:Nif3-like dinuclear metal center hexameric protein [Mycoplasma sp. P36-A1]|uniref:Nif3-like dinuclear metal center hexameric protein n=1 Tax=Mycoplasma sp. P36-A1 TaxID=3252900 RepID=UPI003C2BD4C9
MDTKEILTILEDKFPLNLQEKWDNSGILYRGKENTINVLITLDITAKVSSFAISNNIDLIISHHPLIFQSYFDSFEYIRNIYLDLAENNINIYSMHTNYDSSNYGMNINFIKNLNFNYIDSKSMERYFNIESDFYEKIRNEYPFARIYNKNDNIEKGAVLLGAGGSMIEEIHKNKADVFISSEFKHHEILYAKNYNITLVDISHQSESLFIKDIEQYLKSKTNNLNIQVYLDNYKIESI